jgi:hypothetical protein
MLFQVTHNYLGHHLGYVTAQDDFKAICVFAERTGMALAALVAVPYPTKQADLSCTNLRNACFENVGV